MGKPLHESGRVVEQLFKFCSIGSFSIRVWATEQAKRQDVLKIIDEILEGPTGQLSTAYIANKIARLGEYFINAVEVLVERSGEGTVVYNDWP